MASNDPDVGEAGPDNRGQIGVVHLGTRQAAKPGHPETFGQGGFDGPGQDDVGDGQWPCGRSRWKASW